MKAGYPSSFTIGASLLASLPKATYVVSLIQESSFENSNKNIHSVNESVSFLVSLITTNSPSVCSRIDISDKFSFSHMLEFSKLAAAFAIELGGWLKSD